MTLIVLSLGVCFNSHASGLKFRRPISLDAAVTNGDNTSRGARFGQVSIDTDTIFINSSGTDMIFTDGGNTNVTLTALAAGGAPTNATYITQTVNGTLTNEQALTSVTAAPLSVDAAGVITSGTIQVGRGGTGLTTGTSGGIPFFSAAQTIASSSALTANAVIIGGGVGTTPATVTADTATTGHFLASTATSPAFRQIQGSEVNAGGSNTNVQFNSSGFFGADSPFQYHSNPNTLVISRDSGQTGQAIVISSDTANSKSLSSISHLGNLGIGIEASGTVKSIVSADTTTVTDLFQVISRDTQTVFIVDRNKNVGVGTTTPSVSMDIVGSFRTSPFTLTDAATIATDASRGNIFTVTLGGNRTLGTPTSATNGQKVIYIISQDATGSRTLAYSPAFRFGTDIASPTLSTAAGTQDYLGFIYNARGTPARYLSWDAVAVVKGFAS